ncbi:hypothetical protein EC973_006469 [Apophysomyces ossiformis]|uniref:Ppx/GppA phosphatase domain-containing protein n=1 Tax=Apophysomyces ossiformis TaxID=679940 RepID=A0A8H7BVC8_9FUNG|nr:hypothetical protein EC973_006469 [Apophysomyces ossiformis]
MVEKDMDSSRTPVAVVDMGSNGIRFGIIAALVRHLPVVYEERAPISLLEAQGEDNFIPTETIDHVITTFLRFKLLCEHANVQPQNVKVIATEATRTAKNAEDFIQQIQQRTQWKVDILSKEQEAMYSALGIAGSFYQANGLVMDLGGGSVECNYVMTPTDAARFEASSSPMSLPYGAAVLKKRMVQCTTTADRDALYNEIVEYFRGATKHISVPNDLYHDEGYTVYMSGGGFRALAYLSMSAGDRKQSSSEKAVYPIPIVHGYTLTGEQLRILSKRYMAYTPDELTQQLCVYRISKRRASMIPAICFLVSAITDVIPIRRVYFSEGGVRQGLCYHLLAPSELAKDPLLEEVKQHALQSHYALRPNDYDAIYQNLLDAIPPVYFNRDHPVQLHRLLPAALHLSNLTSHYPKGSRAFVAFHMPLAGGALANVCGISHKERVLLALMLAFRYGAEIPDPTFHAVVEMACEKALAVCKFVGRLLELVFTVTPLKPELGLTNSGISFQILSAEDGHDSKRPCLEDRRTNKLHYQPAKLRVILPSEPCPQVDALAVMSVIESLDRKVNRVKNCSMDDNQRSLHRSVNLFSVDISRQ